MFGLLAELSELALVIFVQIILGTALPRGGFLLQHVRDNFGELMGRGRGGFGRSQFAAHAAIEGSEIARTGPQTLRGHAQGTARPILDGPTPGGEDFATTNAVVRTEPEPGRKMLVRRPFAHVEADFGEDGVDRQDL